MNIKHETDYKKIYDDYWQDTNPTSRKDFASIAKLIIESCGYGSAIDIGCGKGHLVGDLLAQGIDAVGFDVSEIAIKHANTCYPDRFFEGSVLSIPFPDAHFDIIASTDCLEHLTPSDVPVALREINRIASRYVFLQIVTTQGQRRLTIENRAWWEARCFEAGFRKHPLYYRVNPYETLNEDGGQIFILLEKVPAQALENFDLNVLPEERMLHTDMLREVGRRSDAHCIRYYRAAEFIRPGDRVLDVACWLGYGSHILYAASQAKSVLGVDLSNFGIAYANAHYGHISTLEFRVGDAQALNFIPDHSIDFIAAFETIEHVPDPVAYLRELKRVLVPAGRVMVCAPNNWVDETGKDPNPHHLHVYTWERLVAECGAFFLLEQGFLQTAGGALKCHHAARKWVTVPTDSVPQEESEWVLLLGMADPVAGKDVPYVETAWTLPDSPEFHVAAFGRDYMNPWLVKGMVSIGMRSRSLPLLDSMQERVLKSADPESVDYGAALCGRIYAYVEAADVSAETLKHLEAEIWRYAAISDPSPHQLRWQVSLLFVGGELARRQGRTKDAIAFFSDCASRDVTAYSPLLGNKVIDALYWLAVFALCRHDKHEARKSLLLSVSKVQQYVSGSWLNITGSPNAPFPPGPSEIAQLLDKAARAAYSLSVLDKFENKPGVLAQETVGWFERQLNEYKWWVNTSFKQNETLIQKVADLNKLVENLESSPVDLTKQNESLIQKVANLESAYVQVLNSKSWRITKPFRFLLRVARHGLGCGMR